MGRDLRSTKKIYNLDMSGPKTDQILLQPGVTVLSGSAGVLDKYVRLHLHEVDIYMSGAGTVEFKIGNQSVFKRVVTAAGDINVRDNDISPTGNGGDQQSLTISITGSITVSGIFRWSFEWAGGNRVKTKEDVFFSGPYG